MESEGKAMDTNTGESPEHQIKSQYSWETHLVRKRWDIGLLRALSLRIMMMMMMAIYINNINSQNSKLIIVKYYDNGIKVLIDQLQHYAYVWHHQNVLRFSNVQCCFLNSALALR